jgi:hypothetical protein
MEYIHKAEHNEKELDGISGQFIYSVLLPAVMLGSFGWGNYFAKQTDDAGKYFKKPAYASEAKK